MKNIWHRHGKAFGTDALRLKAKYVSPDFYKLYQLVYACLLFAIAFWLFIYWSESDQTRQTLYKIIGVIVFLIVIRSAGISLMIFRLCFGPRVDITLCPEWVKVGGPLWYKTYRCAQYGFAVEPHERAEWEAEARNMNPQIAQKEPAVYAHAQQLVLYVEEKRIVLASIYGNRAAADAMAARLNMMKQDVINQGLTGTI